MKLCKDCKWYRKVRGLAGEYHYCTGPHVQPDIIEGKRLMPLPGARYSGGDKLKHGVVPCRESDAHWFNRDPVSPMEKEGVPGVK